MPNRRKGAGKSRHRRAASRPAVIPPATIPSEIEIDDPLLQFQEERPHVRPSTFRVRTTAPSPVQVTMAQVRAAVLAEMRRVMHNLRSRIVTGSSVIFTCGIAVGALGVWAFTPAPPPVIPTVPLATPWAAYSSAPSLPVSDAVNRTSESRPLEPGTRAPAEARESSEIERPARDYRGSLAVQSGPQGARAFVNGTEVGSTPIVLRDLPVGSRVVRLEADGYHPWSTVVRVIANEQTRVSATLDRATTR